MLCDIIPIRQLTACTHTQEFITMLKKVGGFLRFWSVALIGPSVISALFNIIYPFNTDLAYVITTFVGFLACVFTADDKADGASAVFVLWTILSTILFLIIHIMMGMQSYIGLTTLAISGLVWMVIGADWLNSKRIERIGKREKLATEAREAERQALIERINTLIGDSSQTTALLTAIERLTQYVPEMSERLLSAVAFDAERFVMLRGLESTTTNDVLRKKSRAEADEIASAARKLCADSTEMALELLADYQGIEADGTLGDERGSRLTEAHEEFKRYLESLREIRPYTDDGVSRELRELAPQPATRPLRAQDEIRGLRAKN